MTGRRTICTALLAATASCDVVDLSGPGEDKRLPEIIGRLIAPASGCCSLTWTSDDEEITFIAVDLAAANAYRPTTGAQRTLATIGGAQFYDAAVSADGLEAFTTSSGNARRVIRRHTADGTTVITTAGVGGFVSHAAEGRGVLVSPTQAIAAYIASPDSLFLLRRGGAAVLLGTGCVGLVTFSPDESQILCMATPNRGSYAVFRLDGGPLQPMALASFVVGYALEIHWGAGGIQLLHSASGNVSLYDVSNASTRIVIPFPNDLAAGFPDHLSWSRSGRRIAYGTWPCAQSEGLFKCRVSQRHIYVLDVVSGVSTRLAVHTIASNDAGVGQVAISATGTQIAYTVKEQLYLVDMK